MQTKPKILVIDDEPKNIKLLEAHLTLAGYDILAETNGEEGLKKIQVGGIDAVLLDVMMPGLNGFEVTRRIRENPATRLIPVVLITALTGREDRIRGIEAGCDDFLTKPFHKEEVLARVKTLLRLNHYRAQLDERDKLAYLLKHMANGFILLNPGLKITEANDKAREWLFPEMPVQNIDFLQHIRTHFKMEPATLGKINLEQGAWCFDLERPAQKEHRPLILEIRSSAIRNALNELTGVTLLITDVTEIRQKAFQEHHFLTFISHKLRTPMVIVNGNVELLKDGASGPLNAGQQELIDEVAEASQVLLDTFEKQIGLLKTGLTKAYAPDELVDPAVYFQKFPGAILSHLKRRFPSRKINCSAHPGTNEKNPAHINMSERDFDLIMKNLAENAVKFNENDPVEIDIRYEKKQYTVFISISDNGCGIPPEEKDKIFDLFYQIDKWRTGNIKGTGLGLTLVKNIMKVAGGQVEVHSELGKGSVFTLTFPLHAP